jgi:outer membrane protein assembly factor BamA
VQVPGFHVGTQFFRAGATLRADSRDNYYRPSSGALVEVGADWSHGLGFDQSDYVRLHAATSAVLDLWQRSRTLVIRFAADDLEPIGYYPVPFSEMIVLGGPDTFRGFRPGRFRNFSSVFAGIEYRWPVWMWMDATVFGEYGGVFGRGFEGFSVTRMAPDLGAGVRLRSSDTFYARAQVAYGFGDGWQAFFSVNTDF